MKLWRFVKVTWPYKNHGVMSYEFLPKSCNSCPNSMIVVHPYLEIWKIFKFGWRYNDWKHPTTWGGVINKFLFKICTFWESGVYGHEASKSIVRLNFFLHNENFVVNMFLSFELVFQNKVSNFHSVIGNLCILFSLWLVYSPTKFVVVTARCTSSVQ